MNDERQYTQGDIDDLRNEIERLKKIAEKHVRNTISNALEASTRNDIQNKDSWVFDPQAWTEILFDAQRYLDAVGLDANRITAEENFKISKQRGSGSKELLGLADLLKNPEYSERSTMSDAEFLDRLSKHHGKPFSPRHG